jgi:hypothetical protein
MLKLKLFIAKFSLFFEITGGLIVGIPALYGASNWYENHLRNKIAKEQHIANNDKKLNAIGTKLDSISQYIIKLETIREEVSKVKEITIKTNKALEEHIKKSPNKQDIIDFFDIMQSSTSITQKNESICLIEPMPAKVTPNKISKEWHIKAEKL